MGRGRRGGRRRPCRPRAPRRRRLRRGARIAAGARGGQSGLRVPPSRRQGRRRARRRRGSAGAGGGGSVALRFPRLPHTRRRIPAPARHIRRVRPRRVREALRRSPRDAARHPPRPRPQHALVALRSGAPGECGRAAHRRTRRRHGNVCVRRRQHGSVRQHGHISRGPVAGRLPPRGDPPRHATAAGALSSSGLAAAPMKLVIPSFFCAL
mmetsp:Transcript_27196/g.93953  ORF Transcript_27196/g.93953 Transcript_27196/m.93953 type:complete len:210 (+) Transcript_27196:767-1396(+)